MITGQPVNTKSMAAFLQNVMLRLDKGEIDANAACAQAKLASQVTNLLNYELKRTLVQVRLKQMECLDGNPKLREIESKPFDDNINQYNGK